MVYNYYMKKLLGVLLAAVLLPVGAFSQMMVVRLDGNKVYLDTSEEKQPVTKGSTFKVIVSSETLTNPKTGKNLGEIYHYSEVGTITEVQPRYAVGELKNTKAITAGQQAVWEEIAAPLPVKTAAEEKITPSTRKVTVYEPVEQTIISLTQAAVTAPGADNIITLSDKNEITVFSRAEKNTLKPEISYTLPVGNKGLFISAAAVKEGASQIFAAVYNEGKNQISSWVLENKDGQLVATGKLPYFVKEVGCSPDKKIWGQRPFVLDSAPGKAREIVFEKNKFVASGAQFDTRRHWLAGLNYFPFQHEGEENLLTTQADGTLRLWLKNGKNTESKDLFGSSPLRITYKKELVKFYPSVQVFGTPQESTIAAVENGTKYGLLSETFGQYRTGKIHFLRYDKGSLKVTDTVELDGVLYDTACTDRAILTAEALSDGTSRVVEILK